MKSKSFNRSASLNVSQSIEITKSLKSNEAKTISVLRSLLQRTKKVVIISGAEISVNADSESLLLLRF